MITPTKEELKAVILRDREVVPLIPMEEINVRRVHLSEKLQDDLTLDEWSFLFVSSMLKMFGKITGWESDNYFNGLDLVGYPFGLITQVSSGITFPLAELSAYLDEHKYEVYQMRNQTEILKSIDESLKKIVKLLTGEMIIIPENTITERDADKWTKEKIKRTEASDKFTDLRPLAERLKSKLNENH